VEQSAGKGFFGAVFDFGDHGYVRQFPYSTGYLLIICITFGPDGSLLYAVKL
jgi:hypothetical protein